MAGGCGSRRGTPGGRRRQLRRGGLRAAQAGRRLRLHQAARLPPPPRHPRRHARGPAHPPAQGLGQHAEGRPALHRGAGRPGRARRRRRREAPARRFGVLEHEGLRVPREGGLALLDRRAHAEGDSRGGGGDLRGGLAGDRLPRAGRGADRRDDLRRPAADRQAHAAARPAGRALARLAPPSCRFAQRARSLDRYRLPGIGGGSAPRRHPATN